MGIWDIKLPSMGGGATSLFEGKLNSDINIDIPTNVLVHMFIIEAGIGAYYGSTPVYGWSTDSTNYMESGNLIEATSACLSFKDISNSCIIIDDISYPIMHYDLQLNFNDNFSIEDIGDKYYLGNLKCGNIETDFSLIYNSNVYFTTHVFDSYAYLSGYFKRLDSERQDNVNMLNMFKRSAIELSDKRIFGILALDLDNIVEV